MKILQNQSIVVRISLIVGTAFIIQFGVLGYFLLSAGKERFLTGEKDAITKDLEFVQAVLENEKTALNKVIENATNYADFYLHDEYRISISSFRSDSISIVNEESNIEKNILLPIWEIDNKNLYGNNEFAARFTQISGCNIAIFQKIPGGYLRINSNIESDKAKTGLGYYIASSDEKAVAITNSGLYKGEYIFNNRLFLTSCKPILQDEEVVGFYQIAVPVNAIDIVRKQFGKYSLYETGILYLVGENGKLLLHTTREGENISHEPYMMELVSNKEYSKTGSFNYKDPSVFIDTEISLHYLYLPEYTMFAVISFPTDENLAFIDKHKYLVIIYLSVALLFFVLTAVFAFRHLTDKVHEITEVLFSIAGGTKSKRLTSKNNDEIGLIVKAANAVSDNTSKIIDFATELQSGNLDADFKPNNDNDLLGISLDKMRNSLREAQKIENERRFKEQIENKRHEGISRFNELIRHQTDNLNDFGFLIIKNLTEFLKANQSGIFLVRKEANEEGYIELLATYAYNRKRIIRKQLPLTEGILGRVYAEKKSIYITEIPDDYLEITSGLGHEKPKSLAVVPLKLNDNVIGMIELASFYEFDEFTINFLEEISEIIAKTLSLAENNVKTMRLLVETKTQAEEMASQEEEMRQNLEELMATQEESARREAERNSLMNAIYEAAYVFEFDLTGVLINANFNLLQTVNMKLSDIKGLFHSQLSNLSLDKAAYNKFWKNVLEGTPIHIKEDFDFPNGSRFYADATFTTMKDLDDSPTKVLCILRNLTEKNKL